MSAKLYGRENKSQPLHEIGKYTNYHIALCVGRRDFDHGNFMVEKPHNCGAPSREEQLLLPKWNPNDLTRCTEPVS